MGFGANYGLWGMGLSSFGSGRPNLKFSTNLL
jgi:hypothetical protein